MEDPPENLQGKYDVVHIQLFLIVIDDNNPTKLLSHALKLLGQNLLLISILFNKLIGRQS